MRLGQVGRKAFYSLDGQWACSKADTDFPKIGYLTTKLQARRHHSFPIKAFSSHAP